jgi:A/G-specific adenine glycosylase
MYPSKDIKEFQQCVWAYFEAHQRRLVWRQPELDGSFDVYKILVSEVMLQQTQVSRVSPKFQTFLDQFPTVERLAQASLAQVLTAWSGLGYNRRAKYLHEAARWLAPKPIWHYEDLITRKGIGPNTAAAVCVYAYNEPRLFIETNTRAVIIHHFFAGQASVTDKAIASILEQVLKNQDHRLFYWALMDYGSNLKSTIGNASRRSKHYVRQSAFAGSRRQIRGQIMRELTKRSYKEPELVKALADERTKEILDELTSEGLIIRRSTVYQLG